MFFRPNPPPDPLDVALLYWSKCDPFRVRDLLNSVAVFGRTGSGKSSGSGKTLLRAIVKYPCSGGLILAAKPEDADEVRDLFSKEGRLESLLVIQEDGELRCNFIDCIRGMGGDTREITKAIMTIAECLNSTDSDGREDGKYWEAQQERMLYCAVEVVKLGTGNVTAPDLLKFLSEAAQSPGDLSSDQWRNGYHNQVLRSAHHAAQAASETTKHDLELANTYFTSELPKVSSRTRSSIEAGVYQTLHCFCRGLVRRHSSGTTNVRPEETLNGRWVLVNLPPSKFGDSGKFINAGWKYLVQKAVLRRKASAGDPIHVIWADEAQEWTNSHDFYYLSQCRSHLGCQVFLTQSLHSIFVAMGGNAGLHKGLGLLTNFSTKIIHACGPEDAEFASKLIGSGPRTMLSGSAPPNEDLFSGLMGLSNYSGGFSEQMQPIVLPQEFMNNLRTGGKLNGYMVDAIVVKSGESFSDGNNFKFISFNQRG